MVPTKLEQLVHFSHLLKMFGLLIYKATFRFVLFFSSNWDHTCPEDLLQYIPHFNCDIDKACVRQENNITHCFSVNTAIGSHLIHSPGEGFDKSGLLASEA